MSLFFADPASLRAVPLTLYTEQIIVRGSIQTLQHRVTDILNQAVEPHLVLEDVTLEEYGTADPPIHAEFAQVNLAAVLFAVSLASVEPMRELRTPKVSERALLSVPPFRIVGQIHLLPERSLRDSLTELHGAFVPVTDATFWSDRVKEGRQSVAFVAVNRTHAQVFAPFREVDPWAGVARPAGSAAEAEAGAGPEVPPAG
ncbi:MAG: hypothetical protein M0T75_03845 [Chloroflexi bacterium]|nr:hypothetical protein [Chloroflexota bacterium]